jgi:hypothetical protein
MFIFLDESGDLGFDLDKRGTSKTFTITLLVCDDRSVMRKIQTAVKRTLKNKVNTKHKHLKVHELKGALTSADIKSYFLKKMPSSGWKLFAITVNKCRVYPHLRTKSGKKKLYNFLTRELLKAIQPQIHITTVNLVVDRCKDSEDRKDFNAYIKANLETAFPLETTIYITHENSQENANLQAVDMFCCGIQRKENNGDELWYNEFRHNIGAHIQYLGKAEIKKGGACAA